MRDAATPWAPPTAEQIGLLGVHWSKGWIIENNTISHSICVGITLGKYGDEFDNATSKMLSAKIDPTYVPGVDPSFGDGALAYNRTVERAIKGGWSRETIGSHIVRNNKISFCEQAGIVGSLGAIYSTITGNEIHHIHIRNRYYGDEIAAIKFHAPIDVQITGNHIYRTARGMWLDWMTQGTRISRNLLHMNGDDLVFEIDHGPCLVDNNLLLSGNNIDATSSRGFAFVHNLTAGSIGGKGHDTRKTPFYTPHSTTFAGLHEGFGGDDRFYNNVITGGGGDLGRYDKTELPNWMGGNVFLNGAKSCSLEETPVVANAFNPDIQLTEQEDGWYLTIKMDKAWSQQKKRELVTTALLGKALVPGMAFEQPDGKPLRIDTDYFGNKRDITNPMPGPFEKVEDGKVTLKVW
jgi:alpha-N-arabinofuranosidase